MAPCFTPVRGLSHATRVLRTSANVYIGNSPLGCKAATSRKFSTMSRTYEDALRRLDSIQSNRAVTSLFSPPPPPPPPTLTPTPAPSSSSAKSTAQDLNAQAIPEMLAWAQRAGITQSDLARLKCIHVAGTKGKGSVCAFLTAILTQPDAARIAGKVGTYTSPHLISVRERIQLDGRPISRALFAQYFFEVWDALTAAARAEAATSRSHQGGSEGLSEEELEGPATKPFYFRFLTLVALRAFAGEGVRSAVVECGIGGEHDSTNILPPEAVSAAVVSQLGVDHVGMLGDTLPRIAWHKAGVMKRGRKCFTRRLEAGDDAAEAMRVLRRRAQEKGAVLVEIEDGEVEEWGGVRGAEEAGSLEGGFQKYNQALALRAASEHLRILTGEPDTRPEDEKLADLGERFADGLRAARLRGRCETREDGDFTWLVDGAHTAESLEEVAKWFAGKREALPDAKLVLLFNQQERDVAKLLGALLEGIRNASEAPKEAGIGIFDYAVFTRNDLRRRTPDEPERDLSVQRAAADAMHRLCPHTRTAVVDNVADAVEKVKAEQHNGGGKVAVLATGSLHLVGALLRTLEPGAEL
ncbi:FolC bifunctional protein [Hypoxylon sp. FL0543]|nr:FolC bifunctional protein [Hypoxylon sp. FL0543]